MQNFKNSENSEKRFKIFEKGIKEYQSDSGSNKYEKYKENLKKQYKEFKRKVFSSVNDKEFCFEKPSDNENELDNSDKDIDFMEHFESEESENSNKKNSEDEEEKDIKYSDELFYKMKRVQLMQKKNHIWALTRDKDLDYLSQKKSKNFKK